VQKNGQPVSAENVVNAASRVDLALTLTNIDLSAAGLAIVWDSGRGSFAIDPTNHISAIWVAPAVAGMATISVKISAPDRGSFKVFMPVIVDLAVPAPTHTVSFDAQGGSAVTAQTVESGTQAATPAAPTRIDYTFAGWYKEADCTNIWDFASEKVIANTTVYAKWIAAAATTYTVSFDAQGGSAVTAQTVESGTQAATPRLQLAPAIPSLAGIKKLTAPTSGISLLKKLPPTPIYTRNGRLTSIHLLTQLEPTAL